MCLGHAHPVKRRGGEEVLLAFAFVGAHARRGLALDTYAPQGEAFQFPLIAASGLLEVAIGGQVGPDGIKVVPNGNETEAPCSWAVRTRPGFTMRHPCAKGTQISR